MLFSIGTEVKLIHTGDIGVVEQIMEHDLIGVRLDDGDLIPVSPEALARTADFGPSTVKAKIVPGKKKAEPIAIQFQDTDNQYVVLKPKGVQLAFDPVLKNDGTTDKYRLYLINDTNQHFLYDLHLIMQNAPVWKTQGKLGGRMMIETGSIQYAELNEQLMVSVEVWRLLPEGQGTGGKVEKKLRIKPAQFFKKKTVAPYLNRPCHLYLLFNPTELSKKGTNPVQKPRESLANYTERNKKYVQDDYSNLTQMPHEVFEKAAFSTELDLHIEKLVDKPGEFPVKGILSLQLSRFEEYMRNAIWLGVNQVFIIHGLGEGKLKTEIAKRLKAMSEVKGFVNEYHPRYGYGATEVNL